MKMKIYLGILLNSILLISSKISYLEEVKEEKEPHLLYPEPHEGWTEGKYCNSTHHQSPIEIPSMKNKQIEKNSNFAQIIDLVYSKITEANNISVNYDHGHKWTTNQTNIGTVRIKINGTLYTYKLGSFHFHLYSEHRLESKQYPMELHLVHTNNDTKDNINKYLVLGILFDYADDKENKFLNDIHLATGNIITDASISDLIKKDDTFYYYKGSLTTIPCSENVNWVVFKDVKAMSYEQYKHFKGWVEESEPIYYNNGYGNARGPKPLNDRIIYLENEKGLESSKNNFLVISMVSIWIYLLLILY